MPYRYPEHTDPQRRPRFTGIPTFMRVPAAPEDDWSGIDVGLIGVPFDGGVTNRPGARHGPRAVRDLSSMVRKIDQVTGVAPFDLVRVADLGDAWPETPWELAAAHAGIEAFFRRVAAAGILPLSVGGDHSVTLPILRTVAAERPVGLVQIDAHCDTGDDYMGSRWHHGTPFRRAVEEGLIDPKRTIQIGIRGTTSTADFWAFSRDAGMRVVFMDELHEAGVAAIVAEARRVVGDGPTYVSFDIDSLDPSFAPGTGTPEIGGLSAREALMLLRGLRGIDAIGGDVVEIAPAYDPADITALAGGALMFQILCLIAEATAANRR